MWPHPATSPKEIEEIRQRHLQRQIPDQWGFNYSERCSLEKMTPGEITNDFRMQKDDSTHVKKAKFAGTTPDGKEFIYNVTLADGTKTQVYYSFHRQRVKQFVCRRVDS